MKGPQKTLEFVSTRYFEGDTDLMPKKEFETFKIEVYKKFKELEKLVKFKADLSSLNDLE